VFAVLAPRAIVFRAGIQGSCLFLFAINVFVVDTPVPRSRLAVRYRSALPGRLAVYFDYSYRARCLGGEPVLLTLLSCLTLTYLRVNLGVLVVCCSASVRLGRTKPEYIAPLLIGCRRGGRQSGERRLVARCAKVTVSGPELGCWDRKRPTEVPYLHRTWPRLIVMGGRREVGVQSRAAKRL
jgi:hypothetical protein